MALADLGNELGPLIRIRQCIELFINGGAAVAVDAINQLRSEVEAAFDADATGLRMQSAIMDLLIGLENTLNAAMAACDQIGVDIMRNRCVDLIGSVALSGDFRGLCGDFANYLRDNSKVVLQSTVAVGAVTAGGTNTGTGTVHISTINPWGDASNNQRIQNQDFMAACYADSYTGGTQAHAELFKISGSFGTTLNAVQNCLYPADDGTGNTGGGNRLQNEDGSTPGNGDNADTTIPFENFTTNTPDGWTISVGAAGVDVFEESGAGNYYIGSKSMKFLGTVAAPIITVSQDANDFFGASSTDQALEPGGRYVCGFYLKTDDTTGKIEAYCTGTAYTAGATEKATYDMGASGALASFTLVKCSQAVKVPKAIPTDWGFRIISTTALANTKVAYIDAPFFAKMHYVEDFGTYNHVIGGATKFVYSEHDADRFSWSTTNDHAGLFQEWFSRMSDPQDFARTKYAEIGVPMPASSSASAELAESKAQ